MPIQTYRGEPNEKTVPDTPFKIKERTMALSSCRLLNSSTCKGVSILAEKRKKLVSQITAEKFIIKKIESIY